MRRGEQTKASDYQQRALQVAVTQSTKTITETNTTANAAYQTVAARISN